MCQEEAEGERNERDVRFVSDRRGLGLLYILFRTIVVRNRCGFRKGYLASRKWEMMRRELSEDIQLLAGLNLGFSSDEMM